MPTKTELRLALHHFIDAWLEAGVDLEMVIEVVDDAADELHEVKFQVSS